MLDINEIIMDKVLIIGNGFDIDLGLPTSYVNFCNNKYFQEIDKSSNIIRHIA